MKLSKLLGADFLNFLEGEFMCDIINTSTISSFDIIPFPALSKHNHASTINENACAATVTVLQAEEEVGVKVGDEFEKVEVKVRVLQSTLLLAC